MKRYSIELTAMQWGLVAVDMIQIKEMSESTENLYSLIKLLLDHTEGEFDLPYNIKDCSDDSPV